MSCQDNAYKASCMPASMQPALHINYSFVHTLIELSVKRQLAPLSQRQQEPIDQLHHFGLSRCNIFYNLHSTKAKRPITVRHAQRASIKFRTQRPCLQ